MMCSFVTTPQQKVMKCAKYSIVWSSILCHLYDANWTSDTNHHLTCIITVLWSNIFCRKSWAGWLWMVTLLALAISDIFIHHTRLNLSTRKKTSFWHQEKRNFPHFGNTNQNWGTLLAFYLLTFPSRFGAQMLGEKKPKVVQEVCWRTPTIWGQNNPIVRGQNHGIIEFFIQQSEVIMILSQFEVGSWHTWYLSFFYTGKIFGK